MTVTIIAPHPDDELIGCYSLLAAGLVSTVYYLFDWGDSERAQEAEACSRKFKFKPVLTSLGDLEKEFSSLSGTIYLPARQDSHPHHKLTNRLRQLRTDAQVLAFYSVDLQSAARKVRCSPLKKEALDALYPSQAALWERDASYYLFEALTDSDLEDTVWITVWLDKTAYRVGMSTKLVGEKLPKPASLQSLLNTLASEPYPFEVHQLDEHSNITRSWK